MITVNVLELFLKAAELLSDGYVAAELTEIDDDDELPASLSFSAIDFDDDCCVDYEEIYDCSDEESFELSLTSSSIAPYTVTFNDLFLIACAFHHAIENCKNRLDDKSLSADSRSKLSATLKSFDEYFNKLDSFLRDHSND